jgi:hypothetical protein
MNFDVIGPFEIRRFGKKKIINKNSLTDMCEQVESHEPGLSIPALFSQGGFP